MLNIAVFAPRPNASISATAATKPGLRLRPRAAWRKSRPRSLSQRARSVMDRFMERHIV
jgi:hypothetical protein